MQEEKRFDFKNGDEPILLKHEQKRLKLTIVKINKGELSQLTIIFSCNKINGNTHKYRIPLGSFCTLLFDKTYELEINKNFLSWNEVKVFTISETEEQYNFSIYYDN